ncbi:MAG: SUMF1/EgtB/PvdO family nonheme iron enzyme [Solirubrobacterales bacterium]
MLTALVAQIAVAGGAQGGDPMATISVSKKKLSKLIRKEVQRQLQPGPQGAQGIQGQQGARGIQGQQGAQGPPGTAPACQGNGSGDTMVAAGAVCIDRYEVSVWSAPKGGTRYGTSSDDYPCNDNGQDCKAGTAGEIYARSVPGVTPSRFITYFQAQQALANSGKRLPSNAEWQQAVAGTPDSTACNVITGVVARTGDNAGCISDWRTNDMVGNVYEWVADWDEEGPGGCTVMGPDLGNDLTCLGRDAGDPSTRFPGALIRGGAYFNGANAGPLTVESNDRPSDSKSFIGFRGAR